MSSSKNRSKSAPRRLLDNPLESTTTSRNSQQEQRDPSSSFIETITGNGFSFLNFIPENNSRHVKVNRSNFDDNSDALRLHDLSAINNTARSNEEKDRDAPSVLMNNHNTCFVASDAATVATSPLNSNRGAKTKRRLQWRVGPLIKKPRAKPQPRARYDEVSLAERTVRSVHTFHSTETAVVKNNKKGALTSLHSTGARGQRTAVSRANSSPRIASTVSPLYSEDNDDDNCSDSGTVIEAYQCLEEREMSLPQRTIGLFLYDRESFQSSELSKASKSAPRKKGPKPPKVPGTKALAQQPLTVTPPPQNYNDNASVSSGGPLWQLARLQAISEGVASRTKQRSEEGSAATATDQEKKTKKRFFSFSKSSAESVTSSSSHSQLELQHSHAERNLKAIHRLASQHLHFNEFDEAIDVLEEMLRGVKEMYGERHYRVGSAMHNIATVHMMRQKYNDAIRVCRKAVEIRRATLGSSHPDLAVSYAQLGMAHMELEQHKFAYMAFRNALTIRRQTLSHRDVKISRLLNNIGCCLFELGEMNKADVAFEEALKIQRINMKNTKKSITVNIISNQNSGRNAAAGSIQQNLLSIASTLCNIGSIQLRLKQYEEAAVCLEEALLIQQSVWGDGHATAANTKDSLDFVNKKRNCGKAMSESLQDLILRKMEQVGLSSASGGSTYRVPNPLGIFSDVMSMDKTEWIQVLEDFGGVPVLCKGSAQTPEVATTSSSDSLEGDLHWI